MTTMDDRLMKQIFSIKIQIKALEKRIADLETGEGRPSHHPSPRHTPVPGPRYDDVYFEGVEWLNEHG